MKTRFLAAMLALAVVPFAAFAADEENPYKKVKVGDFATYKMAMKIGPLAIEGTMTQTVSAKDDKEATLKIASKFNGMEIPAQDQKIDLTKPWDPTKTGTLPPGTEAKIEKLKDGEETIKVGGKEYKCKWETYKTKLKVQGQEMEMEMKVWQSKDFNLNMVKTEMSGEVGGQKMETTIELTDSGAKKSD
ncbi:hypothetical protein [Zavarzinella formosa]|uniref:hypothetical protein n=1 Tax=Zavarzinella formosa TaxID=360055 RepID=UPI0002EABA0B|nr:hypothetical protein [Zavarzinella formosa]